MKKLIFLSLMVSMSAGVMAQTSLDKRWNYMIDKANSYNSHKIIKRDELNGMWSAVQDSLMQMRVKVRQEQNKVNSLTAQITALNGQIKQSNDRYSALENEKNDIVNRNARSNSFIYALLIALGVVILGSFILFLLYKKSNKVTMQKIQDYDQLHKSFEEYKTQKLEVERKLKREIQTYMNKVEEMKVKTRF